MKLLILGSTGMLGHSLVFYFNKKRYDVTATARKLDNSIKDVYSKSTDVKIIEEVDAEQFNSVYKAIEYVKPDVVINCIGVIKQLKAAKDPITAITINSLFPHQLANACAMHNARLIHISTDCVFNGRKGNYTEDDPSNAEDLYGRTKYLGEVDYKHAITLRTSIIGHEINSKVSLIDWFLSQEKTVYGYSKALYSGFPTIEIAEIIDTYVLPNIDLHGLYHVSSDSISKYDLLKLVAKKYGKDIEIHRDDSVKIDRTLNSDRFRTATGYTPPSWQKLISKMYADYDNRRFLYYDTTNE